MRNKLTPGIKRLIEQIIKDAWPDADCSDYNITEISYAYKSQLEEFANYSENQKKYEDNYTLPKLDDILFAYISAIRMIKRKIQLIKKKRVKKNEGSKTKRRKKL